MRIDHRGPRGRLIERISAPALRRVGIDPCQYWLLVDLLKTLSSRQEIAQLGGRKQSLKATSLVLFIMFGILGVVMVSTDIPSHFYLIGFVSITALQISVILLPEIAANLVNPSEVTVLAHQPISGSTWTLAKVTHIVRVVVYMVLAVNGIPALAGSFLSHEGGWQAINYTIIHLTVTFGVGLIVGLGCCSIFGWLIRFTPPKRLQAIAAVIQVVPMVLMFAVMTRPRLSVDTSSVLPSELVGDPWAAIEVTLGLPPTIVVVALALLSAWALVFGLRALSNNQLMRAYDQEITRLQKPSSLRLNALSLMSSRLTNQVQRSGFTYMAIYMTRDWQFWRNTIAMSLGVFCGLGYAMFMGWGGSPFAPGFNSVHLVPHLLGATTLMGCRFLAYGSDYKSAWLFTTIPKHFVRPFAHGGAIFLFSFVVLLPHLAGLLALMWFWSFIDVVLFIVFSALLTSFYFLIGLGRIEGIPFGKQFDPNRTVLSLLFMLIWGLVTVATMGIQMLLFLSYYAVVTAVLVLSVVAVIVAKSSIPRFAGDMEIHLDELAVQ